MGAQCVLATHSLAFIPTALGTRAYQLTRTDEADDAAIAPLDPAALTPYAHLAHTVGLDRGELLTRWRAFVFADPLLATIVQQLAGDQLQQSHIRVTPLPAPGERPPPEIALLADLTAAPLILLVLAPAAETLAGWREHHVADRPPPDRLPADAVRAASVVDLGAELELDIELLPLAAVHPFDLVHPDAIRRCTRPGRERPPFPGHDQGHQLHATISAQAPIPYPEFLKTTFGISVDAATVQLITRTMHQHQLPVDPRLSEALWRIERIALDAESSQTTSRQRHVHADQ